MTKRQRNTLSARARWDRQPKKIPNCSCGHCWACKLRQSPDERMAQHLAEVGNMLSSPLPSTLSDVVISLAARRFTPPHHKAHGTPLEGDDTWDFGSGQ